MDNTDFIVKNGHLIEYVGKSEHVEVPEGITAIAEFAFEGNKKIKSVIIPNSVLEIGRAAFGKCENLRSVIFPDLLAEIEPLMFIGCKKLDQVVLPKELKIIGRMAFYQCEALVDIEFPQSLTVIGANAFEGCYLIEKLDLPCNLQRIGDRAFCQCKSMCEITLRSIFFDLGQEIFFEANKKIKIIYMGTSNEFFNLFTSKARKGRPFEAIGNIGQHSSVTIQSNRIEYEESYSFCIEVECQKDNQKLIFANNRNKQQI